MGSLLQDLRYTTRTLLKNPGFTLVAVITLSLGIGANTAVFSVVYGVLLKPLPYKDAERIAVARVSPPDFRDLKEATQVFDQMAIWGSNLYNVTVNGETTQIRGAIVSPEFLPMLSQPALGRFWRPDEDTQYLTVISYDYWQSGFGGAADVIGKTISLYNKPYTIIGVAPPEFQYPGREFKIWNTMSAAMAESPEQFENRQFRIFRAVAHLKPGVSAAQMQAEMDVISERLQRQYPDANSGFRINFTPLYDIIIGDTQRALWMLFATVGLVLLIACANIANLTLSRMATHEREIAIRTALGASRLRVTRQLMTESLLLATVGGLCGLLLSSWGLDALVAFNPAEIPRLSGVSINATVLLFTFAATVVTGLIFGLVPALQASRGNLNQRSGGRGSAGNVKSARLRNALIIAEVALSLVTLISAGLLIKSFNRLLSVDAGFRAESLLTVFLPLAEFKEPQLRANISREVIARVSQIPGVQVAGGGTALPPINGQRVTRFVAQGTPNPNDSGGLWNAWFVAASPDYFRALGTPLVEGRDFTDRDDGRAAKVVIISRNLARGLFPNQSAVGKRLQLINPEQSNELREIVGVVGDLRHSGLGNTDVNTIYTPFAQTPFMWSYLMIRASVPPQTLIQSVRGAVGSVNSTLQPASFVAMERLVSDSVARPRFNTIFISGFAVLALALAAVGIYGVIAYSVSRRAQEIGVRMALGARKSDVIRLVLKQGMTLAVAGAAFGLVGAWAATRLISGLLFEVSATDPATFAVITLTLMAVALLACYVPARRATKVDPMIALRCE
ncbi:MAG: ABC transporter permease [Chloracidobacterium sp.]|nr:ABC transporter permease [Chloracidobacterium sp.]